jgi:ABC-2 type transport system permease protein
MNATLPPVADQASVFRYLRTRLFRNGLRVALEHGRTRLFTMLGTSVFVFAFTFAVGWYLFDQLVSRNIPLKGQIVEGLFDLMFFTLGTMLLFSTGLILYASLFTSPEARYLLCSPARADRIFATKFQAAVGFSSWGFVVLGIPIFLAFGLVSGVPWYFYALLPAYLLGYVLLPGSFSASLCLLLVRYMPRNRKQFLAVVGVLVAIGVGFWLYKVGMGLKKSAVTGGKELDDLIGQFDLFRSGFTPSHWMTRGLMSAARGDLTGALVPLAQVWSNGLLLYVLAAWIAKRVYRTAYDRMAGGGRGKKIYRPSWLDRGMEALVFYLDKRTRVLVVKDFRTFRRDPTQWAVLAIFALLMMLGASNFRQYASAGLAVMDKYAVSLMNLSGTAILLCAGLSRFVFPLISLEGRKFWILGLTPVSRDQLLWGKFVFAFTGSLLIGETLILLSDVLIGLPPEGIVLHAAVMALVAAGLSGMNVGLGAYLPNFRETDPSKIVVGFGGTVNMVAGLGFLVIVIGTMAVPMHTVQLAKAAKVAAGGSADINPLVYLGVPVGVVVGVLGAWLPLRAGARSLRAMEF